MNIQSPSSAAINYKTEFYRKQQQIVKLWQAELDRRLDLSCLIRAELVAIDGRAQYLLQQLDENETQIQNLQNLIDGKNENQID